MARRLFLFSLVLLSAGSWEPLAARSLPGDLRFWSSGVWVPPRFDTPVLSLGERDDPCLKALVAPGKVVDQVNRGVHLALCRSARWFDGLFGAERIREESQGVRGRIGLGAEWTDREEVDSITRFRIDADLPRLEKSLNAFVGRGDREELINDTEAARTGILPGPFDLDDDEWLVGLGYSPHRGRRNRWSYDVGADFEFPINWYARARYRHVFQPTDNSLLRSRQSLFWEHDDGWGVTTLFDWDYLIRSDRLVRWRNLGTVSEGDEGVDWYTELTLFTSLFEEHAFAYQLAASGETDALVTVEYSTARVIYRRPFLREWLFLEARAGVSFRRDTRDEPREARPVFGIAFEMLFGKER